MKPIVISIGGSVILSDDIDDSFFKKFNDLIKNISKSTKVYIIVGGGKTARLYINFGRKLNFSEEILDDIGIKITRINAHILTNIIKNSNKQIPSSTDEAIKLSNQIVIMGGTSPGHSTDKVGAELADKVNASLYIIATNVDGIYNKDPNKYDDAVKIKEINIQDLINRYGTNWDKAGRNIVIDGPSLSIIKKAKLKTVVLNGKKIDEIKKAISNQDFNGTIIKN